MKLRILSVICAIMLVLTSIFALPVGAETASDVFTDELNDLSLVSSTDGDWCIWAPHQEVMRTVAARNSTDTANNLYYCFSDKYIDTVAVTVAEYEGFFSVDQVPVAVRSSGSDSWTEVTMIASAATDITEATNQIYKQIVLTCDALPENVSEIRVGLTNAVAWTLFIDSISMTFSEKSDLQSFTDTLETLDNAAASTDNWQPWNPHPTIGLSLLGRKGNDQSDSYIYYNFENKYISSLVIDAVVYSGGYTASSITADALVAGSEKWQRLNLSFGEETAIESSTEDVFKAVQISAVSVPESTVALRLGLTNDVAYAIFFNDISLKLLPASSSGTEQIDYAYFTDELISLSKTSDTDGDWETFASHEDCGLSVAGRQNTNSENNLYYEASDSYIRAITVKIVENNQFDPKDSIKVSVRENDSSEWIGLNMTFGSAQDIKGYEASSEKSMTLAANVVYPAITQVRVSLCNDVAWTLFVDSVTLKLENNEPAVIGDVTGDGAVNIIDLVNYRKAVAQNKEMGIQYDLDGDTKTQTDDIVLLRKYLLGTFEFDSAEALAMKRETVSLKTLADNELAWIASTQLSSGAIPVSAQTAAGDATINPYFADYAAMALLERPELYAANVANYINWHFNHLNEDGTIYDYTVTGGEESNSASYDSTDSYAATFLSLLNKYYQKTGETAIITDNKADIEKVVSALRSTLDNGLTYAKSDYLIKYTMDNCEVLLGLKDAASLYTNVIVPTDDSFAEKADELSACAKDLETAIEAQLWNADGYYEIGLNEAGNAAFKFDWSEQYPSAMAQLFPIFTGVIASDSERAEGLYADYISQYDITNISASSSYYSISARTAAVMGDKDTVRKYLSAYSAMTEMTDFRYTPYTAHVVMAAEIMRQNIIEQIG